MLPSSRSPRAASSTKRTRAPEYRARPQLEALEDRIVPTVQYYGGNLLDHVQVQGVYLGADWYNNSTYYGQTGYLESALYTMVTGSYMDALTNAGYYVYRGGFSAGTILTSLNAHGALADSTIRNYLQNAIHSAYVQQPNSERLYVIFVQDNVNVYTSFGDSINNFLGYHGAFFGTDYFGTSRDIRYAVIPYHGTSGNAQIGWLGTLDSLTEVVSHEVAEAVTDPDVSFATTTNGYLGWYDTNKNSPFGGGEVGDIANGSTVYLNGYLAVQRISNINDQPMTPQGATPQLRASFVLQPNGWLWEHTAYGWTFLSSGVAKISDQAIDNHGRAFIDVIGANGNAYEYHDGSVGWVYLWYGAYDAKVGEAGNSYVLFTDSSLWEYKDYARSNNNIATWTNLAGSGVSTVDTGTNYQGVSTADIIFYGNAWQWTDVNYGSSSWSLLGYNVAQLSAGHQGIVGWVDIYGNAYINGYFVTNNVAYVSVGTDYYGGYTYSTIGYSGAWWQYDQYSGWSNVLSGGVAWLSKEHNGNYGVVGYNGYGYDYFLGGFNYLYSYIYAVS